MTLLQAIEILELELPTTADGLKKAYRKQAKLWHPDNFSLYEQQVEAGRYFIRAKEAYDLLAGADINTLNNYKTAYDHKIVTRNREAEQPGYNNSHPLFESALFKEFKNVFSLFYLLTKWQWFGLGKYFKNSFGYISHYINFENNNTWVSIFRVFMFMLILVGGSITAVFVIPLFAFACLLFIPLLWLYIKSVKVLSYAFTKLLGYIPAPNCKHWGGELIYLGLRSIMPGILLVAGIIIYMSYPISRTGWLFLSGYPLFLVFIGISIVYEWVMFARVQYLRQKINTQ